MPQQAAPATNRRAPQCAVAVEAAARLDHSRDACERQQEACHPASTDPLAENRPRDEHRKERRQPRDDDRAIRGRRELEAVQE